MSRRMCRSCSGCSGSHPINNRNYRRFCANSNKPAKWRASKATVMSSRARRILIPGRIRLNRSGRGFLQPDDSQLPEISIAESDTGTAWHEDRVLVRRNPRRKNYRGESGEPETGVVVRILERQRTQIVGTLQRRRQFLVCRAG